MSEEPVLRPEEVAGVLSKDGEPATKPSASGPQPYSLREPVAIPASAEAEATRTLARIVAAFNDVLRGESAGQVEIGLDGLQQHRAEVALSALPAPIWVCSLVRPGGGGVSLALHPVVALALVDLVLGGAGEIPEEGREATPLEARVATKIVASAAKPIAEVLGVEPKPLELRIGEVPPEVAAAGETVGVGLLRLKIGEGDHSSLLLVTASLLLPSTRRTVADEVRAPGPLAPRLDAVGLETRLVLRAGRVSAGDLVALREGQVLRLDAPEDAGFDLRVSGCTVAHGSIARRDGGTSFTVQQRVGVAEERRER